MWTRLQRERTSTVMIVVMCLIGLFLMVEFLQDYATITTYYYTPSTTTATSTTSSYKASFNGNGSHLQKEEEKHDHDQGQHDADNTLWWNETLRNTQSLLGDLLLLQHASDVDAPDNVHRPPHHHTSTIIISCGTFKCFFPSKNHPGYGYIIGQSLVYHKTNNKKKKKIKKTQQQLEYDQRKHQQDFNYHNMQQAYEFSQKLQSRYGVERFRTYDLSPPISLVGDEQFVTTLNHQLHVQRERTGIRHPTRLQDYKNTVTNQFPIIVQAVKSLPQPINFVELHLISHFNAIYLKNNLTMYEEGGKLDQFLQQVVLANDSSNVLPSSSSSSKFLHTVQEEFQFLQSQLLKEYPQLVQDFQCIITLTGQIYHLDLDRIWGNTLQYYGFHIHQWNVVNRKNRGNTRHPQEQRDQLRLFFHDELDYFLHQITNRMQRRRRRDEQ